MLLDEPFGALDAITRSELQDVFAALRSRLSMTSVLVTHDLHEAFLLATHIAVLRHGRIEQTGVAHELQESPATPYVRMLLERARITRPVTGMMWSARVGHRVFVGAGAGRLRSTSVRSSSRRSRSASRICSPRCSRSCSRREACASIVGRGSARRRSRFARCGPARSTSIPSTPAPGCWRFSASRRLATRRPSINESRANFGAASACVGSRRWDFRTVMRSPCVARPPTRFI